MRDYVSGFMYSPDMKKVVLIEKLQPEWQRGLLNGVGGKIEEGESPQEAMSREFEEEAGLQTASNDWKIFSIIHNSPKYKVYFLYTTNKNISDARTMEAEEINIYDVDSLPQNVIHNLRWLIPMSQDPKLLFQEPVFVTEE